MTDVEASAVRDILPPLASGDDITAWSGEAMESNPCTTIPKKLLLMRVNFPALPSAREVHEVLASKFWTSCKMSFGVEY